MQDSILFYRLQRSACQRDFLSPGTGGEINGSSPLLAAAASVRGFIDTVLYLIDKGLHWIAEMLENTGENANSRGGVPRLLVLTCVPKSSRRKRLAPRPGLEPGTNRLTRPAAAPRDIRKEQARAEPSAERFYRVQCHREPRVVVADE